MGLSLEVRLNSLNFSTQLQEVKDLLDTAQTRVNFWGTRVVELPGDDGCFCGCVCNDGSVSLDSLAGRVLNIARQRCEADDLQPAERIAGMDIVRALRNFYQVTDAQTNDSNFFTRFLVWIREFNFLPYTTRFFLERSTEFMAYSEEKFDQQFGGSRDDEHMGIRPGSGGSFGPPLRIVALEDRVRAQLIPV